MHRVPAAHGVQFNDANVGNGFLAYKVGDHCHDARCTGKSTPPMQQLGDSQKTLGGLHIAGMFNGLSNYTPSHRARLPSVHNVYLAGEGVHFVEQALDVRRGVFTNTTRINGAAGCAMTVQQRLYCHRSRRNIMVLELQASPVSASEANCSAAVTLMHREEATAAGTVDVAFSTFGQAEDAGEAGTVTTVTGATRISELYGTAPTFVALAYDMVPHRLTLTAGGGVQRFLLAAHTDQEGPDYTAEAARSLHAARASSDTLMEEHIQGWDEIWRSGIETEGNLTVSRAVNASLYYIHSALRQDWPHGLSPGGLAIDSYDGRSFWDVSQQLVLTQLVIALLPLGPACDFFSMLV
jgi:hypothetical protein